jgi:hypothetical protein
VDVGWMLGLLVFLLVACIVIWGARRLMAAWGVEDPIATTVYVVLVVVFGVALVLRIVPGALHM